MPWDLALEQASRVCGKLNLSVTATQPSGWSSSTDLALRLDTGVLIDGEDVRTFARRLMDVFRDDGSLDDVVGWKTGGVRYLVWSEPTHQAGHAFKSPLEYVVGDKSYFFECHASRQTMMNYVLRLLKDKGYKVVAVGEAARSWTDSVDVSVESPGAEVASEAGLTQVESG